MGILDIFKRKAKEPPSRGMIAMFGKNPVWTSQNITALTDAGYRNCMTVFRAVSLIGKAAAGIPWILFEKSKGGKDEKIADHALLDLIKRPNPLQGQAEFIEGVVGFYYCAGNSYALAVGPDSGKNPQELYWLYPQYVHIIKGDTINPIAKYGHNIDQSKPIEYTPEEVLHLKTFHPLDQWYGLSPLSVAARGIDIHNLSLFSNMKLLQNDMRPAGAVKVDGTLTPDKKKMLKADFDEYYIGAENTGRPLVLEGGQEWIPFAISPRDAEWLEGIKQIVRFLCITLGVPPELMGDAENKTYSNQKEARKGLYEETILPFMDYLRDELNNWLTPKFGDRLYLEYDRDSILALKEDRSAIFERAQQSTFLTINEKRRMTGYEDIDDGEQILVPISMVPMGARSSDEGKAFRALSLKSTNKSFWQVPERKEALWNNFVIRVKAKEKPFVILATQYMNAQAKRISKALKEIYTIESLEVGRIFDLEDEAKEYQKKFFPWYVDTMIHAGEAGIVTSKGELYSLESKQEGFTFNLTPDLENLLQEMVFNSGTAVNQTMIDIIYRSIQRGLKEGWTVAEFAKIINHQVDELMPWRSRLWARTETAKIENWGQIEGYKQAEFVEKKGWLSAFAPDTRDEHMAADAQYSANPIGLDEPFFVGGENLQYPGDPVGSAGNVCNCLCDTYPEVVEITGE